MRTHVWKVSTLVFAGALALVLGAGLTNEANADPQPAMHTALDSLEKARERLEAASHDKGGHRVKALQATKIAIAEVKAGIVYDNQR